MGALAGHADLDPQRALTAGFDDGIGGFEEDGEIAGEPIGVLLREPLQTVARGLDFLVVIEDERDVAGRLRHRSGEVQQHGDARLHVGCAAAVHALAVAPGRHVVDDRDGIEMAGEHHSSRAAEAGERHDGVTVANHAQVRQRA